MNKIIILLSVISLISAVELSIQELKVEGRTFTKETWTDVKYEFVIESVDGNLSVYSTKGNKRHSIYMELFDQDRSSPVVMVADTQPDWVVSKRKFTEVGEIEGFSKMLPTQKGDIFLTLFNKPSGKRFLFKITEGYRVKYSE